jgi:serine/threonine-protein kinase RsbT
VSRDLRRTIQSETDARHTVLEATLYSREAGFGETHSQMIATVVSELTRNILKYAGRGEVCMRRASAMGKRGIEIEVVDSGPGIPDCEAAMKDHYSSGGTLGLGLPGVKRMMDEFWLESVPGEGTRVTVRKWL